MQTGERYKFISRCKKKGSRDSTMETESPDSPLILPNCIFKTRDTKNMENSAETGNSDRHVKNNSAPYFISHFVLTLFNAV